MQDIKARIRMATNLSKFIITANLYVAAMYGKRRFKVIQEVKVYSTDIVRPAYQG